jgi:NCAIR mutase (PurE)-related protein
MEDVRTLLEQLAAGQLSIAEAETHLERWGVSTQDTADACVDVGRRQRCGYAEVVYGSGKSPQSVLEIFACLSENGQDCLGTRIDPDQGALLQSRFPDLIYNAVGRTARVMQPSGRENRGRVVLVSAGTSDAPVFEEAFETLKWMRCAVDTFVDVGVAGPQRLDRALLCLRAADAVVVVAGMEGALASVVGGHVACPVIAVPTSVGYGANLGGLAPLLAMLNSCAANVAVVNIDAGFKGAYLAGMMANRCCAGDVE